MCMKNDNRIEKHFKIAKNLEEEFISLLVDVDKICIASDAEERENAQGYSSMDRFRLARN